MYATSLLHQYWCHSKAVSLSSQSLVSIYCTLLSRLGSSVYSDVLGVCKAPTIRVGRAGVGWD